MFDCTINLEENPKRAISPFPSLTSKCFLLLSLREKMPFHHVTAGLLYKGNYLSRSLSDSDSNVLASISVEELDGEYSEISINCLAAVLL